MIEALLKAQNEEDRLLEFIRSTFLLLCLVGFVFYGVEHWVLKHYLDSWQSKIPLYTSLIGFPITLAMFFNRSRAVRYPFLFWMAVTMLVGMVGALLHLVWNANDAEVALTSFSGIKEAFEGERPVLAALAQTHIGAVGMIIGITIRDR